MDFETLKLQREMDRETEELIRQEALAGIANPMIEQGGVGINPDVSQMGPMPQAPVSSPVVQTPLPVTETPVDEPRKKLFAGLKQKMADMPLTDKTRKAQLALIEGRANSSTHNKEWKNFSYRLLVD